MVGWDLQPGETIIRRELHRRWGGSRFGGMEPAVKAESIFLFTKPAAGREFGYVHDGWSPSGELFYYTGDGQQGDQSPTVGGNRALLAAPGLARTIRLFRSSGTSTTYIGPFELDNPPFHRADAPDRDGEIRSVMVFHLRPAGAVERSDIDTPPPAASELPLEGLDVESYVAQHPDEPPIAVRREAQMVARYAAWLAARGERAVRHRIPLPGENSNLYTDVFNLDTRELIEAKASEARTYIRTGLGQILDYARFLNHRSKALLLPRRPSPDLIELLREHGVGVIFETTSGGFDRA